MVDKIKNKIMLTKMHENDRELLGWAQYVFLLFILLFFFKSHSLYHLSCFYVLYFF